MFAFIELAIDLVVSLLPDILFDRWEGPPPRLRRSRGWVPIGTVDHDHAHALRGRLLRQRIPTRLRERGDGRVELLTPAHHRETALEEVERLGITSS